MLVANMWILVLCSLQDHLLPEELLWEEGVMQLGLRNVEQEVERPTVVGEAGAGAGAVNEDFCCYV